MDERIAAIYDKIRGLESQLEAEMAVRRADLKYRIEQKRIIFEEDILKRHAALKTSLGKYLANARPIFFLTAPFIYALIVPLVLLDLFVTIYQAVCFPVYRIEKVRRADYLIFDRAHLQYLNAIEKVNCAYCSYGNGILGYAREIASRTEQYWCPIKHAKRMADTHARYGAFLDYGDAEGYHSRLGEIRDSLKQGKESGSV